MNARQVPDVFQVAFSLAGEQRDLVRDIAEIVEAKLGESKVFYDDWYLHYIAGPGGDIKLQEIYRKRCELAVVCISGNYGDKDWTQTEYDAIRARMKAARGADAEESNLAVFPIRVGDGDVPGIYLNTIVPDARNSSAEEMAELIVNRLQLMQPQADDHNGDVAGWPDTPPDLNWNLANHTKAHEKFGTLLTKTAPWQFLPIVGTSETGKSIITKQMFGNALRIKDLTVGRFDFKGTTDMDEHLRGFARQLNVAPPTGERLTQNLSKILDALRDRKRITLLIFDTYEFAETATDWMENQLLPFLLRADWLRLVVAGQEVPKVAGTIWEANSCRVVKLKPPPPEDWFEYGRKHKDDLTLEDVKKMCRYSGDKASLLSQLLGP